MKSYCALLMMLILITALPTYAQNSKSAEILGKKYSVSYEHSTYEFEVCEHSSDSNKSCNTYEIINKGEFEFLESLKKKLKENVDSYQFNILDQKKKLSEFKDIEYDKVELVIDLVKLNASNKTDTLLVKLKGAPKDFAEFKIVKDPEDKYKLFHKELISKELTIPYKKDIIENSDEFKSKIHAEIIKLKKEIADSYKLKVEEIFNILLQELYDDEISKDDVTKLLEAIDEEKNQYSGKLTLNEEVPCRIIFREINLYRTDKKNAKRAKKGKPEVTIYKKVTKPSETKLKINNALVQFFNNKASTVYFEAEFTYQGKTETLIFLNNQFSVPIRFFNIYGSSVTQSSENKQNGYRLEVSVEYNDVFDYESDQFFNYSVANSQVILSNEKTGENEEKVIQRRFFDFFTGIVYTDVLGFNTENSNSLLNAQAKLLVPMNLMNWGKFSATRMVTTSTNIALNNSFEDETRFISIDEDGYFSNFDLLRNNNLFGKMSLDVLTYESKGWFLNTSIGYQVGFYRTGFRFTETNTGGEDKVTNKQLLSVSHGPYLNFEIRPQTNFGADINIGIEDLNYNDIKSIGTRKFKNDIIEDAGNESLLLKYNLVNIEANFYWLTDPDKNSKGGIFAKLGTYYHTENHSIFPQFMVGYATNLTSFVNRFNPKKSELKNN